MKLINKYGVVKQNNGYAIALLGGNKKNWQVFGFNDTTKVTALDVDSIVRHMQEQYYPLDIGYSFGFVEPNGGKIILSNRQVEMLKDVSPQKQQQVLKSCIAYVEMINKIRKDK